MTEGDDIGDRQRILLSILYIIIFSKKSIYYVYTCGEITVRMFLFRNEGRKEAFANTYGRADSVYISPFLT